MSFHSEHRGKPLIFSDFHTLTSWTAASIQKSLNTSGTNDKPQGQCSAQLERLGYTE